MRVLTICRLAVLGTLIPYYLLAQPYFFRKDILVGFGAYAVVAGDFNGDDRSDLAVATAEGLYVLINAGGGNFLRPVRTEEPANAFWLPEAADFNGDGWDDLVGSGFLYLGRGDGTFLPGRYLGFQEAVAAADFNSDGKTDLLLSNYARDEGVRVLLGNGDGTFTAGPTITAERMNGVRVADFNHDGRSDVATVSFQAATYGELGKIDLLIFLGRADGTFDPEVRTGISGLVVMVADFNGDELPDVLNSTGYELSGDILLGNGDGSFQSPLPYQQDLEAARIAADFTGDGMADVVAGPAICPGKGDGTLLAPVKLPVTTSYTITASDLDGDGRYDLVTRDFFSNTLIALMTRDDWAPELRRAMSSAGNTTATAPGSLATLYVRTGATANEGASPPWPTQLGGIQLEVLDSTGVTHLAPLLFVSGAQINFQVPEGASLGEATLTIAKESETTMVGSLQVDQLAPRLFTVPDSEIPAASGMLVELDGTQVQLPMYQCPSWTGEWSDYFCDYEPIPLSSAGDRRVYLSFYGTGFRGANTANVTCSVNSVWVPVVYAGPQESPGVEQINIQLLPAVLEGLFEDLWSFGFAQVVVRIDGVAANPVMIQIQ